MLELARASDFEAVRQLSVQIHDLHVDWRPDIYYHCEEPYSREKFLEDIRNRLVYVAKIQDQIVGYTTLSVHCKNGAGTVETKQLRIDSICVDRQLRCNGIGRAMVTDIRALARAFGYKQIILGVHPENDVAVAFYQKCGFFIRTIQMDMNI